MEQCTLYSHEADFNLLIDLIKKQFPKAELNRSTEDISQRVSFDIKGGLFGKSKNIRISFRARETPSYNLGRVACPLSRNLAGMHAYVTNIESAAPIKFLLLKKIETINSEFSIVVDSEFKDEAKSFLLSAASTMDAVIFAQPNTTISQAASQHFLDKNLQLLLDTSGNSMVTTLEVKIKPEYFDVPQENTPDQLERKNRTEEFLRSKGIPLNVHLPATVALDDLVLRRPEEILDRMYALTIIAAKGEGVQQEALDNVRKELAIKELSPYEEYIFENPGLTPQESAYATWRYEGMNLLLWALGQIDELVYPSDICDVSHIVGLVIKRSRQELEASIKLRTKEEILDELDKTYRMHWACVNARIKGENAPGGIDEGIVYERHYALNWLTCYNSDDWDDVQTDT